MKLLLRVCTTIFFCVIMNLHGWINFQQSSGSPSLKDLSLYVIEQLLLLEVESDTEYRLKEIEKNIQRDRRPNNKDIFDLLRISQAITSGRLPFSRGASALCQFIGLLEWEIMMLLHELGTL